MVNEIVKYDNRLNNIALRKFNSREMDLFFSIASRVQNKGTTDLLFSFDELKSLSNYTQHGEQFVQDLDKTYHKLLSLNATIDDGHTIKAFVLFTQYLIDRDTETVKIAVNPEFKGIFNELSNWTRFSLMQFTNLRSTYSKTMFRLLKQYRVVGERTFPIDEFRALLDVPKSYSVGDIDKVILKPIKEELSPIFKGLAVRKLRGGRGGKITGYKFSWKPERKDANDFSNGKTIDQMRMLENIEKNGELSDNEKFRAIDKVKGLPLGTTEREKSTKKEQRSLLEDLRSSLNKNN